MPWTLRPVPTIPVAKHWYRCIFLDPVWYLRDGTVFTPNENYSAKSNNFLRQRAYRNLRQALSTLTKKGGDEEPWRRMTPEDAAHITPEIKRVTDLRGCHLWITADRFMTLERALAVARAWGFTPRQLVVSFATDWLRRDRFTSASKNLVGRTKFMVFATTSRHFPVADPTRSNLVLTEDFVGEVATRLQTQLLAKAAEALENDPTPAVAREVARWLRNPLEHVGLVDADWGVLVAQARDKPGWANFVRTHSPEPRLVLPRRYPLGGFETWERDPPPPPPPPSNWGTPLWGTRPKKNP